LDGTGEGPGEQLGVHGDGVAGLDAESVGGPAAAGGAGAGRGAPGRAAEMAADGVRDVPRRGDRAAVPGGARRGPGDLPAGVVEAVAGGVAAAGGAAAVRLVVTGGGAEVGVRMPRSARAVERREGVGDGGGDEGQSDRGGAPRAVGGACPA